MLQTGSLIDGKYRILKKIGQGGMSVVYLAVNERANKKWAVKEVKKDGVQNFEVVKQRLLSEIEILKKLEHRNLPSIIDVIDEKESFLIVMDLIEGKTLDQILKEEGAQSEKIVIGWAKQLCNVLEYLHSRTPAIIYRDMKPSNVIVKPDGTVILFDFGAAREYKKHQKEDTVCLGTLGYAAPEQYGGKGQTDERTDIYGLGAMLYHLLTGYHPGESPCEMEGVRQKNPYFSEEMEQVILKCTRKDPKERYQSATELFYALEYAERVIETDKKQQMIKLKKFLIPAGMAVFCGIAALVFHSLMLQAVNTAYETYLNEAEHAVTKEAEIKAYQKAIDLDPFRLEGYEKILKETFLEDDMFTREESEAFREILLAYGNGKESNETVFQRNRKAYETFSYELGIVYYYKYEEKNNKKSAKSYFETARSADNLEKWQIERANRLYVICEYYARIGVPDHTGDGMVTYQDYWKDLIRLSEGNLVEEDNEKTALIMYEELLSQIITMAAEFKNSGVTREEMEEQITDIRNHLQTDFSEEPEIREKVRQLFKNADQAEQRVRSAFETKNDGK